VEALLVWVCSCVDAIEDNPLKLRILWRHFIVWVVGLLCCGDLSLEYSFLSLHKSSQVSVCFPFLFIVVSLVFFIFFCIDSCFIYLYPIQL
jgi:hypothetical protein